MQTDIVSENTLSTVVAQYERTTPRSESYQSEAELEATMIAQLQRQGYEYAHIHHEDELISNLRRQLEKLNDFVFTDNEWQRFFKTEIANEGKGITEKAETIQRDNVKSFTLDSGEEKNIYLIDTKDVHHNSTQVINQYEVNNGKRPNRYDVTILVNGLPLVHIELKRRGVSLKEAFNQINRYGRESFWAGCSLYEYVQIFVISNGTETKYYSNTTRDSHIKEQNKQSSGKQRPKTCNSFEFTSYWADGKNKVLGDLEDFTATFLTRHSLLNILTKFCVLTDQKVLMVMRPYQIAATEKLLNQIEIAHNAKLYGTRDAGGYIWHTTGSGKTLTSFKAAQLACKLPYIDKVMFVVDRKDLDYQTMKEYDRFQKGAANGNTSTKQLQAQIENAKSKIIITTIQKLATFIKKNPEHDFYKKEVVMIFDECHRSQFGDMHTAITKKFKKYYLFGFTGTPIFVENVTSGRGTLNTTEDVFGKRLHAYTIVDAIRDHNVLKFRVAYISTMKEKENVETSEVWDIAREKALEDPRRIQGVAAYILEHFAQQTKRGSTYSFNKLVNIEEVVKDKKKQVEEVRQKARLNGFNSIFAVQSIHFAKLYYEELKKQMEELPENKRLKIATIFSYAPNEEVTDEGYEDEDSDSTAGLDESSRDFLEKAIEDYNGMFGTSYDTSATQPLRLVGRRILSISPFYTMMDHINVDNAIHACLQEKGKNYRNQFLSSFFHEKLFFKGDDFRNKEEIIRFLGQKIIDFGLAEEGFVESVLKRESLSSTCFFETFAIPHAMDLNARKTMLCVLVSEAGIPWDEHRIHIVLMIAVQQKDRKEFMKLYNGIVQSLENPQKVKQLISANSHVEFINYLKN